MTDSETQTTWGPLGAVLKSAFQVAYVTRNSEEAREDAAEAINVGPFELIDISLDVIDESEAKIDEMQLKVSFALERAFEIVEPVHDPCGLWSAAADHPLSFHHVGAIVDELEPSLAAAQERGVPVLRLRAPMLDVAFVDLESLAGHRLQLLCPRAR